MQERICQPLTPHWQPSGQVTTHDHCKYYYWLVTVLLTMLAIFLFALFADAETNRWFIKEGGVIESMSAAGYLICVILMMRIGKGSYLRKHWYFPVVLLAFAMRELDFDKKFTDVGILKSKFLLSPGDSVTTKIICFSIVFFVLFAAFKILLIYGPGLLSRMKLRMLTPIDWSAGIGVLFLFVSKSLDGLDRKLGDLGIVVGEQTNAVAAHLEESLEWAIPFLFSLAVLMYFSLLRRRQLQCIE